ncbi:protein UNUSUAL FLORAL ORGANS [Mercurialis annua]|uniref:protein UNUSUAL FLORAL ORGANS n=1 Tax=Mercurialis annua TaxID=3986 RepID=UPI00215E0F07|nr:protein UNUSUAL FLORAL ORGANS [Mercurialis annua]
MEAFNAPISIPFAYTFTATTSSSSSNHRNASTSRLTSSWMDTRIWSKLPLRLVDRVIAFLPPPAFFRARSVCKRWYALLFSNSFLELYIQVSPRRHWFLFFKHKTLNNSHIYTNSCSRPAVNNGQSRTISEGFLFDPYETAWYRISFGLIPNGLSPAASSGGLICWVSDEAGTKSLILCNPLVGSFSQLPPTLRPRLFPSIGLTVGLSSIDVAVAGDDLISPYAVKNLSTESFHIDANGFYSLWGTTSALPRLCSLESGQMIFAANKFYCMNYNPFSVLAYDITANNWIKIQAPMRRFLRSPSLVESRGKLIMVAAVEKSKLNVPKSLRLWSLQPCGATWVEIERMPQQLYVQFSDLEGGRGFNCVGHGEFIAIMIRGSDKSLLFDICRKMWQWIPPCPYVMSSSGDDDGELHGFAYEPKLAVPVTALLHQLTLPFQSFSG